MGSQKTDGTEEDREKRNVEKFLSLQKEHNY